MSEKNKPILTLNVGKEKLAELKARFNKIINPKVKKAKLTKEEYTEILSLVRRKFSSAFPKSSQPIKMLKIGIHKDLCAKLETDEYLIWKFLYVYTKKKKYQLSLKVGMPRFNLKGKIVGYVLEEEISKPPKTNIIKP